MFIKPSDLAAFADIDPAKAEQMIEDAIAMAVMVAPCLSDGAFHQDGQRTAAVRAIVRGAILRWHEAGSGAVSSQQAGPFQQSIDTRQERRGMFWPSEIVQLRELCTEFSGDSSSAFTIETAPVFRGGNHADICSLHLGGATCSCGAYLTVGMYPLWEGGVIS